MVDTDTREKLVSAAERLFAERGADNVSLREINRAAGQKNVAALHYYFGSRRTLMVAIFERRMTAINERRLEMLHALDDGEHAQEIRDIVSAMVVPLAEQLADPRRGSHYIRFLAQAVADPDVDVGDLIRGRFHQGFAKTRRLLRTNLSEMPKPIADQRIRLAGEQMVYALADRERRRARDKRGTGQLWLFVDNLIDSIAGMLTAPISDATRSHLSDRAKRSA